MEVSAREIRLLVTGIRTVSAILSVIFQQIWTSNDHRVNWIPPSLRTINYRHAFQFITLSSFFSYLNNNKHLQQLPLDIFDNIPLTYL